MPDPAEPHVTWEQVVDLARRIEGGETLDAVGVQLARVVIQFHVQTIGKQTVARSKSPPPRK